MHDMVETEFRMAMRRLAATVTILTLQDQGRPMGMAATAVCSLSIDPPSILACINQAARLHPLLVGADRFGLNILADDQDDIVRRFSDPRFRKSRFDDVDWHFESGDVPVIAGSQASLVCARSEVLQHASHSIVIGEVISANVCTDIRPLLYVDGGFARHVRADS